MTPEQQLIERMAAAIYRQYEDRPIYAQVQMNGILADELAKAALAAIRETHAIVPRELIDALARRITDM